MKWNRRKKDDLCTICNRHPVRYKGFLKNGERRYGKVCNHCYKRPYTKYKENVCSLCGFIPVHRCQLDIHHVDNNHNNNDEDNLITLCANCHRLFNIKK